MKCPKCQNNQKYKEGMRCNSCGYNFVLDPKAKYGITDAAFKAVLEKLSGSGIYFFTYNQLYTQVYRAVKKKHSIKFIHLLILDIFLTIFFSFILVGGFDLSPVLPVFIFIFFGIIAFFISRRPFSIPAGIPADMIQKYNSMYPIKNMVDGTRFKYLQDRTFDSEFLQYAPERIMIVEHNDMVDMLLLNRYHFENKTLVVSADKYPKAAFKACQGFLKQHPDIPVLLIHDCSEEGIKMQSKLLTDKSWNLDARNINNLGLHPKDVDKMKSPIWLPEDITGDGREKNIINIQGQGIENMHKGCCVPVDMAPPQAVMGTLSLAAVTGMALLSEELLAQQRDASIGTEGSWGGYG